jgi:hypothetical protein
MLQEFEWSFYTRNRGGDLDLIFGFVFDSVLAAKLGWEVGPKMEPQA